MSSERPSTLGAGCNGVKGLGLRIGYYKSFVSRDGGSQGLDVWLGTGMFWGGGAPPARLPAM